MTVKTKSNGQANRIKDVVEATPVHALNIGRMTLTIEGLSSLITQRFSEKARKAIEDKQQKKAGSSQERPKRDPKAEFLGALYVMPGRNGKVPAPGAKSAKYGIPAAALKMAAVNSCRFTTMKMTEARGALFVLSQGGGLVQIDYDRMEMNESAIRLPNGALDMRYRPEFFDWSITFEVEFDASFLSAEQVVNLFERAGFHIGIGEWRPEKGGGEHGRFRVKAGK